MLTVGCIDYFNFNNSADKVDFNKKEIILIWVKFEPTTNWLICFII